MKNVLNANVVGASCRNELLIFCLLTPAEVPECKGPKGPKVGAYRLSIWWSVSNTAQAHTY